MLKNLIVLPDGTELYSGNGRYNNIRNATITKCVNSDTELTLGSVCAAMLECRLQTPGGGLNIADGTEITLHKVDDSGTRHKVGLFTMEKPTRPNANAYQITAYDRVSWLDKDLTNWLAALDGWPYTVSTFARMVCEACGLMMAARTWLNGDYEIQQFIGDGITGRQLMKWIGEIEASFVRANPDGEIELGWYTRNSDVSIGPNTATAAKHYLKGTLSYSDYEVQPIERVQLRLTGDDVGVIYPESEDEPNTYAITGNYLLTTTDSGLLEPVAENIYEAIKDFTYTPCEAKIWANLDIDVGQLIDITDRNGNTITTCIMTMTQSGQGQTMESTGSARRDSSTVANNVSMGALNAKMLEVKRDISGLEVKATSIETTVEENQKKTLEQIAAVQIQADGISTSVSADLDGLEQRIATVEQDSTSWGVRIEKIETDGVNKVTTESGVTVDDEGLHVWKDGEPTQSTLDHEGLDVTRTSDGQSVLTANVDGVNALNITVRKYLTVGNTRFEPYTSSSGEARTAMFVTGGS